jgi:hypothetical protein
VGSACSNLCITITGKLNVQRIQEGDATSIQKHSFPGIFPIMKIIPITETEIKSQYIPQNNNNNHQVMMKSQVQYKKLVHLSLVTH